MFLSYEYLDYKGLDPKTGEHRWKYRIVDSEWEAEGVAVGVRLGVGVAGEVACAVIQEYGKRELPVAANLIRAFQFESSKYGHSIERLVDSNKQYNTQQEDGMFSLSTL